VDLGRRGGQDQGEKAKAGYKEALGGSAHGVVAADLARAAARPGSGTHRCPHMATALELVHALTRPRLGSWCVLTGPQRLSSPVPGKATTGELTRARGATSAELACARRGPAVELTGALAALATTQGKGLRRSKVRMGPCPPARQTRRGKEPN
jgi:hypothetical protein